MAEHKAGALAELRAIFAERCVTDDERRLDRFSTDQVGDDAYAVRPLAVVSPTTTDEVVALMRWANETGTPVTPRGAGSGLAGAAIPAAGGVVCSFASMNQIVEIDTENLMVELEPGVVTNALDAALEPHGLFFAGYPMSEDICFIGGNVALNAGGGRAIKYGVTAGYVLGAEVVTPTGEVLQLGGRRLKDVTGYNLLQLLVGSEGTLGLFTRITLRVIPRPSRRAVALVGFATAGDAARCVSALRAAPDVHPSSIEFMDGPTARETNSAMPRASRSMLPEGSDAFLLIEVDGDDGIDAELARALALAEANAGAVIHAGSGEQEMDQAWKLRKQIPWYVKRAAGRYHSLEDVVVPPAAVTRLVDFVAELRKRYDLPIAMFGHAGDGNFHVTPMKPESARAESWPTQIDALLRELYREVVGVGGTISGEHGIGRKRVKYLADFVEPEQLSTMRAIKNALDPNGVLNPGVVLEARTEPGRNH
ncbi:MAG: FAD-binding oxidoreductase [bacterium]